MRSPVTPPRTVAFVHGAFVTKHCWRRWVPRFEARGYRCVVLAYPGRDGSVAELRAAPDAGRLASLTLAEVLEHVGRGIAALEEKPLVVGHSFGGLLTQLLVQRDLAAGGVAIDSVPPQGVLSFAPSFLRGTWPPLNPLVPASRPYLMTPEHFRYAFTNDLAPAVSRAVWDAEVVPESRRLARSGLGSSARIDFRRAHAPLLLVAGGRDHIIPASLNRTNWKRYRRSGSVTDFQEFPGRTHYSVIGGPGWEEVADHALDWAVRNGCLARPESSGARASDRARPAPAR